MRGWAVLARQPRLVASEAVASATLDRASATVGTSGPLAGTNASGTGAPAPARPALLRDPRIVQLLIPGSFTVLGQTALHFRITPVQLLVTWAVCCAAELLLAL